MDHQSRAEFRLKPSGLRRHDFATIGNVHDLLHGDRIEGQSHLHLSAIYTALELSKSTQAAHEVDALTATQILDAQQFVEYQAAGDIYIEHTDRIGIIVGARLSCEAVPLSFQLEGIVVQFTGLVYLCAL